MHTKRKQVESPQFEFVTQNTTQLSSSTPKSVNVRLALKTTLLPTGNGPDRKPPVLIRKGTGCAWSVYHIHRSTDLYGPGANKFRPEIWEGSDLLHRIGWGYMPFHGGPRICLGQEFALIEVNYGIIRVVQVFPELRLPPDEPRETPGQEKQSPTIVVSSAEGCKVLLK